MCRSVHYLTREFIAVIGRAATSSPLKASRSLSTNHVIAHPNSAARFNRLVRLAQSRTARHRLDAPAPTADAERAVWIADRVPDFARHRVRAMMNVSIEHPAPPTRC